MAKRLPPEERELRDKRIRELRAQGLSQSKIAAEVGCSQTRVGYILNPELAERVSARSQEWLRIHPDRVHELQKKYRDTHKEVLSLRWKKYHEANRERLLEKGAEYRRANAELLRERNKAYREANAERMREAFREYYRTHPEQFKEYRKANSGRYRDHNRRRRALVRSRPSQIIDERILLALFPYCGLCGLDFLPGDRIHIDHIIPISKGGWHTWANVQPAHGSCNEAKCDRYDPNSPQVIGIKWKGLTNFERDYLTEEMERR